MATSGSSNSYTLLVLCMVLLLLTPNTAQAAVNCNQVYSDLYPCVSYVIGRGGNVPASCCYGIQSLSYSAAAATDRQAICRCIQSETSGISLNSYSLRLAAALPAVCGVRLPYSFSPNVNCNMDEPHVS
ncbi:unnamed protein product [Rhodiola kirilowii]